MAGKGSFMKKQSVPELTEVWISARIYASLWMKGNMPASERGQRVSVSG